MVGRRSRRDYPDYGAMEILEDSGTYIARCPAGCGVEKKHRRRDQAALQMQGHLIGIHDIDPNSVIRIKR